jgi:DNA polymerase III, alpha subunit
MCFYCNYHKHTHESNIYVPDSAVTIMDYIKRTKELDHKILTSLEHGYQGRYLNTYDLAKTNGLKFIFGTEAYWVKNRHEKDKTNAHICLFAKSEKGRRDINRILSEANINGYYFRPRIDLNLISTLDPNEVFITSACIAFWQYEDIEEIVVDLHKYFGKNFMLEVQAHNTEPQKKLHKRIIEISKKYDIEMIAGCDSHYIYPEQSVDRDAILEAKGVYYEDEEGWYMDYPDGEELVRRFKEQGVLSDDQIYRAMKNTEIFLEFDDYNPDNIRVFSKDIKLPTLYPELSQEERNKKYTDLLNQKWNEIKTTIPKEKHRQYIEEIRKEGKIVLNTGMADYFLIDHEIVKRGIEKGGIITSTGRGSGVSFFTNTLLGFSKVDRIAAPVKLYPERFMSESRILQTRSLPDLDLNLGTPEIFAEAQREILGEDHAFPMIAYGTFKDKAAFKLYAKAQNIPFEIANEITKQIEDYERDLKHADDDEKDLINIYDYIEKKYHEIFKGSRKYTGIISDKKPHPCGWLIYDGNIKEEIGLIKLKSESTGKEVIACLIDGDLAERFKFLKNDLLKVDVVLTTAKIYERIGKPVHTETELLNIIRGNQKVWDIYAKGYTVGVNQVEKASTTQKVMKYKPQNISELTAFIAAIRPAFQSMYEIFESRKPFSYGIPSFDQLIQTEEMPNSFVLYQEQTMATLQYAGFPADETYGIIKAISKKKPDVVRPLKERFINGFSKKIIENEKVDSQKAIEMSEKVWQIIEDSSGYGFNASHAYSYALDSVYCAYLKSHYPLYFYEVLLQHYSEKKDKHKISLLKQEMQKAFGIKDGGYKFRFDNRTYVADEKKNIIYSDLSSVKYMNTKVAEELYALKDNQYDTFTDLLVDIEEKTSVNSRQLEILIKLNYFSEFGGNNELLEILNVFKNGKEAYKKDTKK